MNTLTKFCKELVMTEDYPGIMQLKIISEVSAAKADITWTGGKIPPEVWAQVLSFFRWTNTEHHSESQVRLFHNSNSKTWAAWAFPQEARTGMTAKELDTPDKETQREQFPTNDGWLYLGTVHHHCSGSAFQSGTDQHNEQSQDGLHITVGNMDKDQHDIHARFYFSGNCIEPDMSWFWDIGPITDLIPPDMHDKIARWQMCRHVAVDFPNQWKENVIEVRYSPPAVTGYSGYVGGYGTGFSQPPVASQPSGGANGSGSKSIDTMSNVERVEWAFEDLVTGWDTSLDLEETLILLDRSSAYSNVVDVCAEWGVTADDLLKELRWNQNTMATRKASEQATHIKINTTPQVPPNNASQGSWDGIGSMD